MGFFEKAEATKIYTSISGPELLEIVREMGFVPELRTDGGGDPMLRFKIEGLTCSVWFYGVKEGRADSLQFSAGFADKIAPAKVNQWNSEKRYLKAYLDSDGDVIGNMDVDIDGGVSREFFIETLKRWRSIFMSFAKYMAN